MRLGISLLVPTVVGDRWQVICPICGRTNLHGAEVGHRASHCPCHPDGYVLAPPNAVLAPYDDCCVRCGVSAGIHTPFDLDRTPGGNLLASYDCGEHAWTCYWGERSDQRRPPATGSVGTPCALYRHFDNRGQLLYVGISDNPIRRAKEHARDADWVHRASRIEAVWLPSRAAAEKAEREAIRTERPLHNKAHNTRGAA